MFPVDIGCLGLRLMDSFHSLTTFGQAFAIDGTLLHARGKILHKQHLDNVKTLVEPPPK